MKRRDFLKGISAAGLSFYGFFNHKALAADPDKPNIIWICVEDMSPNMSCYGETVIQTPNIDKLAAEGVKFNHAYVTCPVCSPSRSAMITGMYQTTVGAHNHRSSRSNVKLKLPREIKLVPEHFKAAGYYVSNGGNLNVLNPVKLKKGKTDYNFVFDDKLYDGTEWTGSKNGQPFFTQIQLRGGKFRNVSKWYQETREGLGSKAADKSKVKLPPYYPDDPVLIEDWAQYLDAVQYTDLQVGWIMNKLKNTGLDDNTYVFFWTDHGISHVRDKQFLYEGGIHVPLIIWGPNIKAGHVRDDLVEHIDIPVTSMALAGIKIPPYVQGKDLFADDYTERKYIFAARDRCDETVERIRAVRSSRFKYIRNFYSHRPHAQPNRYKDGKKITTRMRRLYEEGKLTEYQARMFKPARDIEELYDLKNDPYEINNLATDPDHKEVLLKMRYRLSDWIRKSRDIGQFPEPVIAEMLKKYETPMAIMRDPENLSLVEKINSAWYIAEEGKGALHQMKAMLADPQPAVRFVAAMGLGNIKEDASVASNDLEKLLDDPSGYVRVAAARACCFIGLDKKAIEILAKEMLNNDNEVTRHYAALGIEDTGDMAKAVIEELKKAQRDKYEYVVRVSDRILQNLNHT